MYVCNCKGVTDNDIRKAVSAGATNIRAIRQCTGATSQCGKCVSHTKSIISEALHDIQFYDAAMSSTFAKPYTPISRNFLKTPMKPLFLP